MDNDETTQPATESSQPEPAPTPTENQNSEENSVPESPQEPMADTPIPPTDSTPVEVPPAAPETSTSSESAILVKDQNDANEPLNPTPEPEPNKPNITIEKHGTDTTITEVMEPTAQSEFATAQMAGNEPLNTAESEKIKQRKENLEKANLTRQNKKREKTDEILNLFAERQKVTNDEVEKLLHVSDATATRYLETLEKEGKIRQVGKIGKYTHYEKI